MMTCHPFYYVVFRVFFAGFQKVSSVYLVYTLYIFRFCFHQRIQRLSHFGLSMTLKKCMDRDDTSLCRPRYCHRNNRTYCKGI